MSARASRASSALGRKMSGSSSDSRIGATQPAPMTALARTVADNRMRLERILSVRLLLRSTVSRLGRLSYMARELAIEIASDVICPWCYIGKRRLEKALALLEGEVKPELRWLPFELNPDMPAGGMPRAEYRKAKFGSFERARELDARVAAEGRSGGIDFGFERVARTPNTRAAHE